MWSARATRCAESRHRPDSVFKSVSSQPRSFCRFRKDFQADPCKGCCGQFPRIHKSCGGLNYRRFTSDRCSRTSARRVGLALQMATVQSRAGCPAQALPLGARRLDASKRAGSTAAIARSLPAPDVNPSSYSVPLLSYTAASSSMLSPLLPYLLSVWV